MRTGKFVYMLRAKRMADCDARAMGSYSGSSYFESRYGRSSIDTRTKNTRIASAPKSKSTLKSTMQQPPSETLDSHIQKAVLSWKKRTENAELKKAIQGQEEREKRGRESEQDIIQELWNNSIQCRPSN